MTLQSSAKLFILLGLALSAVQSLTSLKSGIQSTGDELGFDRCSHDHLVITTEFIEEEILKHLSHAKLTYEFVQCSREAPVGSTLRNYNFEIRIGKALCKFSFQVTDVDTHKTYQNFNPLEIQDINHCKTALTEAYPKIETSGLEPPFSGIEIPQIVTPAQEHIEVLHQIFESTPSQVDEKTLKDETDTQPGSEAEDEIDYRNVEIDENEKTEIDPSKQSDLNTPVIENLNNEEEQTENVLTKTDAPVETSTPSGISVEIQTDPIEEPEDPNKYVGIRGLFREREPAYYEIGDLFEIKEAGKVEKIGSTEKLEFHNQHSVIQPTVQEVAGAQAVGAQEVAGAQAVGVEEVADAQPVGVKEVADAQPIAVEEEPIVHRDDPKDAHTLVSLPGGWIVCEHDQKVEVQRILTELATLNILKAVVTYTENITCEFQIVAGRNFRIRVDYNDDSCKLDLYEDLNGKLKLVDGFKTTSVCAGYFTESYIAANPSVLEP